MNGLGNMMTTEQAETLVEYGALLAKSDHGLSKLRRDCEAGVFTVAMRAEADIALTAQIEILRSARTIIRITPSGA